jgi:hypothetical protein
MMTILLKLNSMNLPRGSIFISLARTSEHGPEDKMRKKVEYFNLS